LSTGTYKPYREYKGKSLLALVPDYVAVDIETTGLDPQQNDIIEIGAIRIIDGQKAGSFSSLINPGYEIDEFITGLTGITNEMLASAPAIEDVLPHFLEFVGESIVLGHNVNFDVNFIYDNCESTLGRSFANDFVDTMRLSRRLYPEHRHHRLSDLVGRFGVGEAVEHRALADAEQTFRCYEYMKMYICKISN